MDISLEVELERQETLYLLLKVFIECSVVKKQNIEDDLKKINLILEQCVRDRQYLYRLELWFLSKKENDFEKRGEVIFTIDWSTHSLELGSGNTTFNISYDDVLGSINPLFRKLADILRVKSIRDSVVELHWRVQYVGFVYEDETLKRSLSKKLALSSDPNESMNLANSEFNKSDRQFIKIKASETKEMGIEAIWKK